MEYIEFVQKLGLETRRDLFNYLKKEFQSAFSIATDGRTIYQIDAGRREDYRIIASPSINLKDKAGPVEVEVFSRSLIKYNGYYWLNLDRFTITTDVVSTNIPLHRFFYGLLEIKYNDLYSTYYSIEDETNDSRHLMEALNNINAQLLDHTGSILDVYDTLPMLTDYELKFLLGRGEP